MLPRVDQKQKAASSLHPFTSPSAILHCIELLPYSDKCFVTDVEKTAFWQIVHIDLL